MVIVGNPLSIHSCSFMSHVHVRIGTMGRRVGRLCPLCKFKSLKVFGVGARVKLFLPTLVNSPEASWVEFLSFRSKHQCKTRTAFSSFPFSKLGLAFEDKLFLSNGTASELQASLRKSISPCNQGRKYL